MRQRSDLSVAMRQRWLWVVVVLAALAGCVDHPSPDVEVSGTFTEDASRDQIDELADEVRERGGEFVELESFPVQFRASQLGPQACEEVRTFAEGTSYVAEVGDCELAGTSGG